MPSLEETALSVSETNQKPKRKWLKITLAAVLSVLLIATAVVVFNVVQLSRALDDAGVEVFAPDGSKFELPTPEEIEGELNILLIGSDDREDQGSNYGDIGDLNADVIMLLHVSADRSNAVAISFPRDLMVAVPSCQNPDGGAPTEPRDYAQINSTLNIGGPNCVLQTVQQLTGVEIPHLAVIDFRGVIMMSRALGGVEVCVAEPIRDRFTDLNLDAGYHTLEGKEALQFLRTRYGVGDGSDLSRISNQQVFLSAMVRQVKNDGVLTNPIKIYSLANAAVQNMQLSEALTNLDVMVQMARTLNDVDLEKITFLQAPTYYLTGQYEGRVGLLESESEILFEKIRNDQPVLIGVDSEVAAGDNSTPDSESTPSEPVAIDELIDGVSGTNAATDVCQ